MVDNGSTDGSGERLAARYPEITLLKNETNLGFAAGNNVGLIYCLEQGLANIFMLNNDTVVDHQVLKYLIEAVQEDSRIGIVGPKIYFYDRPDRIWFAGGRLNMLLGQSRHLGFDQTDRQKHETFMEVDFVTGCSLLVRAEVVTRIGLLDPDYYHSHEDLDLCIRAQRAGYRVLFVPQAKVWHKVASASGGVYSPFYLYYPTRNRLLFMKKNASWIRWFTFLPHYVLSTLKQLILLAWRREFASCWAILLAVCDFCLGRYGRGRVY